MLRVIDRGLALISGLAAVLVLLLLFAGPGLIGAKKSGNAGYGSSSRSGSSSVPAYSGGSSTSAGQKVFTSAGCATCHTLKAAGTTGTIGPNLDQLRPSAAAVSSIVQSGSGAMPSFAGKLSSAQISAVAQYVAGVAGR
ncbi:MAG TPA: cytochrome c [Solirubrobacteraceae bacterium]|nr:cytochrome c [Solirubrobacteraceae bacterium]